MFTLKFTKYKLEWNKMQAVQKKIPVAVGDRKEGGELITPERR